MNVVPALTDGKQHLSRTYTRERTLRARRHRLCRARQQSNGHRSLRNDGPPLKTIVNGEAGRIFCGRDGLVNVWDRAYMQTQGTTMAGTFTDTPATVAGFGYDEIQTNQAQNFVYNSAVVTAGSIISATAQSVDSVAQYGQRNYEVEAALSSAGDAVALATFLATEWATPSTNVASVSVQAFAFTQANFDTLARIELQQGIRVYRRLPGGRTLDVNCVVEGIEIDITPSTRRFTFYLSPRDTVSLSWPS